MWKWHGHPLNQIQAIMTKKRTRKRKKKKKSSAMLKMGVTPWLLIRWREN